MELFASTVMWEGGDKLTVCDKTQGVQNVQRYLCSVFEKKAGAAGMNQQLPQLLSDALGAYDRDLGRHGADGVRRGRILR